MVAFANTHGGTILVGVSDDGRVVGVQLGKKTLDMLVNEIFSNIRPYIPYPDVNVVEVQGKKVIVIDVPECPSKPLTYRAVPYKRVGSTTRRMEKEERYRLVVESTERAAEVLEVTERDRFPLETLCIRILRKVPRLDLVAIFTLVLSFTSLLLSLVSALLSLWQLTWTIFPITLVLLLLAAGLVYFLEEGKCPHCGRTPSLVPIREVTVKKLRWNAVITETKRTYKCLDCGEIVEKPPRKELSTLEEEVQRKRAL